MSPPMPPAIAQSRRAVMTISTKFYNDLRLCCEALRQCGERRRHGPSRRSGRVGQLRDSVSRTATITAVTVVVGSLFENVAMVATVAFWTDTMASMVPHRTERDCVMRTRDREPKR
jgi:hypothetical protein